MHLVLKIVDELTPVFFLQGWDIAVCIHSEPDEAEPNTAAKMEVKNCYRMGTLYVYPRFFKEDEQEQHNIVIHELCHIVTGIQNGLIQTARRSTQVSDAESAYAQEEETSWMAQIISRLYAKKDTA